MWRGVSETWPRREGARAVLHDVALVFSVLDSLERSPSSSESTLRCTVEAWSWHPQLSCDWAQMSASTVFFGEWLGGLRTGLAGPAPFIPVAAVLQVRAGADNGVEHAAGDTLLQVALSKGTRPDLGLTSSSAVAGSTIVYPIGGFILEATGLGTPWQAEFCRPTNATTIKACAP